MTNLKKYRITLPLEEKLRRESHINLLSEAWSRILDLEGKSVIEGGRTTDTLISANAVENIIDDLKLEIIEK